jgi:hypothetical protein
MDAQVMERVEPTCMFSVSVVLDAPVKAAPSLEKVRALQNALAPMEQVETTPEHLFAPGMYVRRLPIPAGLVVVGKMHRHAHPVMLTKGETTILTDKGIERITAPHVWVSEPGAKRVLYTHTDCEFVTVHLNEGDSTDLDALEADIIVPEPHVALPGIPKMLGEFADELQAVYA